MIEITLEELKAIAEGGGLDVGETYKVMDYPTYSPILTPVSEEELSKEGTTDDGWSLLFDIDKGKSYYVADDKGNSAWFDFPNTEVIEDSTDITILPYYDNNGKLAVPDIKVVKCSDVVIGGGSINIDTSSNIIIGENNTGTISQCSFITIGDNNTNIELSGVEGCTIGNGNEEVDIDDCCFVYVGDRSSSVSVTGDANIVGSDSQYITISGDSNIVKNDCNDVSVSSDINAVDGTRFASVGASFNLVDRSEGVGIVSAVGNDLRASRLVNIENVNNNDIFIDNLTISSSGNANPEPFLRYRNNTELGIKVAERLLSPIDLQSDNTGAVLNTDTNTLRNLQTKGKVVYRQVDGVWTTAEEKKISIDFIQSKTDTRYVIADGAGEYASGTVITIKATMLNGAEFNCFVDMSDGSTYTSNPLSFTSTENKTFQVKYTV